MAGEGEEEAAILISQARLQGSLECECLPEAGDEEREVAGEEGDKEAMNQLASTFALLGTMLTKKAAQRAEATRGAGGRHYKGVSLLLIQLILTRSTAHDQQVVAQMGFMLMQGCAVAQDRVAGIKGSIALTVDDDVDVVISRKKNIC